MQWFRKSLFVCAVVAVTVSVAAAPQRDGEPSKARRTEDTQKQTTTSPWMRLIHKILDDVIPPPESKLSVPPG